MNTLGDCQSPKEGVGNTAPLIMSCPSPRKLLLQLSTETSPVRERPTGRRTSGKMRLNLFVYPESGRFKPRFGQRKS